MVAITSDAIETQGRTPPMQLEVDNRGHRMSLTAEGGEHHEWDKPLVLKAAALGMIGGVVFHNGRVLGSFSGDEGEVILNPRLLGIGPVTIEARGVSKNGPDDSVAARPLRLAIRPPAPLVSRVDLSKKSLSRGMLLKLADGKVVPIQDTRDPKWLAAAGVKPGERYELDSTFNVAASDVYQFQIRREGELSLRVDRTVVHAGGPATASELVFAPVPLAEGSHRLQIVGRAGGTVGLQIAFGGPGAVSLEGARFRHED